MSLFKRNKGRKKSKINQPFSIELYVIKILKLPDNLWTEFLDYIGKKIYTYTINDIQTAISHIENEYDDEKRRELFTFLLEEYKTAIMDYFSGAIFPSASCDHKGIRVTIQRNDMEHLIFEMLNIRSRGVRFINDSILPSKIEEDEVLIEDLETLISFLNKPFKEHILSDSAFVYKDTPIPKWASDRSYLLEIKDIFCKVLVYGILLRSYNHYKQHGTLPQNLDIGKESIDKSEAPLLKPDYKEIIDKTLHPLNCKWSQNKIMTDSDYTRLVAYVTEMIKTGSLPDDLESISLLPSTVSTEFIRFTFYLLHKKLYGRNKKQYWITFLHMVFQERFSNTLEETTFKNFATFRGNYDQYLKGFSC